MFHDPRPVWLGKAQQAARTLKATTRGERRAGQSVYVVLLHDGRRADPWGLYVGQTSLDPDAAVRSCPIPWCNCGGVITAISGVAGLVRRPGWAG